MALVSFRNASGFINAGFDEPLTLCQLIGNCPSH